MARKDLFLKAFTGEATSVPPAWEQAFSSDVASKIIGRPAYTGSMWLHYQEALASCQGDTAYQEFRAQILEDQFDLARELKWSAISHPWLRGRPTKQLDEETFLYGDEGTEWVRYHWDPVACTFGPVAYSTPITWQSEEEIARKVEEAWRSAENWKKENHDDTVAFHKPWLERAGDEFEYVAGAGGLFVPLNEEWMIACAVAPKLVGEYLQAQMTIGLQQLDILAELGIRIANGGGDLASKNGPLYGPKFFREYVMPCYKRIVKHANSLGIHYMFRSDGDLWSITDMIFGEEGAACRGYGEIDYDSGMTIPELQSRYPKLTCFGNIPCPLLHDGSEAEVRAFVHDLKEKILPHGRWILSSANTILAGTPVRNVIGMLEEGGVL